MGRNVSTFRYSSRIKTGNRRQDLYTMKSVVILAFVVFVDVVHCKNAWDTEASRMDLENREAKRAKTSIIAYHKNEMSLEDVEAEAKRIGEKCTELECPCTVTKLINAGVFEVVWSSDNHPSVDKLVSGNEVAAEDELVDILNAPPPTDPRFSEQWALSIPRLSNKADINIEEGWTEYLSDAKGGDANGPSVVVAVIDTGVDYNHPDLKDVMWTNPGEIAGDGIDNDGNGIVDDVYGADFTQTIAGTGDPIDRHGHGSHCSGIIAASPNNGEGIAGVASFTQGKVKIMALKGLSDSGGGSISGLLACLNYAIEKGAKISSNSWGGGSSISAGLERMWDAVLRNNLDHLFIAAAGNSNGFIDGDNYKPMTCGLNEPNLLCVGSSTRSDSRSGFSNYGKDYVHVMAPGSSILSCLPNNRYASWSGTSMACPQVSGLAALIMTMRDGMSAEEVRRVIEENVQKKDQYRDLVSTGGLIDVGATIKALKSGNPGSSEAPPATTEMPPATTGSPDCLEENTHYKGGAIKRPGKKYRLKNIESAEECQLECQANTECQFFTWNSGTGPGRWNKRMKNTCWLKKEKVKVLKDCGKRCTGRVSGPKFC